MAIRYTSDTRWTPRECTNEMLPRTVKVSPCHTQSGFKTEHSWRRLIEWAILRS
jgi:hypothetical protein